MNEPIGPDLYRCSQCNDLTGMRDGPCGRCGSEPGRSAHAPQPTTITKCALCGVAFTSRPDGFVDEALEREAADHHAVCPKRPIEVGDAVLWEFPSRETWAEGRITALDLKDGKIAHATILVTKHSGGWGSGIKRLPEVGEEHKFGCLPEDEITIRRIPRPEAQATVPGAWLVTLTGRGDGWVPQCDGIQAAALRREVGRYRLMLPYVPQHVKLEQSGKRRLLTFVEACFEDGLTIEVWTLDNKRTDLQDGEEIRVRYVAKPLAVRTAHGDIKITADPTLKPGEVVLVAPALVDGIDREVCLARWMENRLAVEGGAAPPNVMTRMQVDVGRELWLQRFGAARSAELRARVAADREAERNRMRVEVQDVD